MQSPDNTAFHSLPRGGVLLRWVGADNAECLLAGALAAPDELWERSDRELVSAGMFFLMDAAMDGRDSEDSNTVGIPLGAGRYRVDILPEWSDEVRALDGVHDTMVQAIRLTRRRD